MALRAGYKGIKKLAAGLKWNRPGELSLDDITLEDKIADTMQPYVVANTKLIKDTVGFIGKNKLKNHANTTTNVETTFTVNSDKSITINTISATAARRVLLLKTIAQDPETLPNGKYTIYTLNENTDIQLVISGYKNGAYIGRLGESNTNPTFDYDNSTYDSYEVGVIIEAGKTISNQTIYPMICDAKILDTSYEPNHESVDSILIEHKTTINAIITAATGAADFAAFKTAMGAITPVTRSIQVTPETREEITEPEEKPEVKKTTSKKSTAKADTEKEGE